ncbi:MAG: hypothetical protein L6R41_000999 [Letrouitia leprolyta]|nr:MAG: hypothetical protein L6R41_000999 [Letrouitia leprolyta]
METESVRQKLNSALEFENWTLHNDYKAVSVLAIYWQDGDMPGFKDEAFAIGNFFTARFHYDVEYFAIPSDNSHIKLDQRINTYITHHGDSNNLMIVHYGGHGDPDTEPAHQKLAVWAALSREGPTVDWSIIQPKFVHAKAEVLLLLDCCFAAQAARNNQNKSVPANVELLAACAMGCKSPPPGPYSFTSHLMKQLESLTATNGSAKISDIALHLADRGSGYRETPIHFSGLGNGRCTVSLEPFSVSPAESEVKGREMAWLTLRVSLRDTLSEDLISEIILWLKARPNRKVARLTVENVVQSTNDMCHFVHEDARARVSGPTLKELPEVAQVEVLTAWNEVKSFMTALALQFRSSSPRQLLGDPKQDVESQQTPDLSSTHSTILLEIEKSLLALQNIIQLNVMALPTLRNERESLIEAIKDTNMQNLGFTPLLDRRLKALFPSDSGVGLKMNHDVEQAQILPRSLHCLVHEHLEGLGPVIVEYKTYEQPEAQSHVQQIELERMEQRIDILARLLQNRGPSDLHTLQCVRWFHERRDTRFGLVFECPTDYDGMISLRDLIGQPGVKQKPTLAQRFSIVKQVGDALLKWHISANWVHQGIASHNIYFLKFKGHSSFDFSTPYIFGYEFSRPSNGVSLLTRVEDFEQNVYRHPDRQGLPNESQKKKHDLYSFGILMFEVGHWILVGNLFDEASRKDLSPRKMSKIIKRNACERLGHRMGAAYARAATHCLEMEFGVELDDAVDTQLAKAFENLVLKSVEPGTCLD